MRFLLAKLCFFRGNEPDSRQIYRPQIGQRSAVIYPVRGTARSRRARLAAGAGATSTRTAFHRFYIQRRRGVTNDIASDRGDGRSRNRRPL